MLSQRRIARIRSLHRKKERYKQGLFLVEGVKPVLELLKSRFEVHWVLATKERLEELGNVGQGDLEFIEGDRASIENLSSLQNPEGVLAVAAIPEQDLKAEEFTRERPLFCFEGLSDPGNLGTLLRLADHFDLRELLLSPDSVDPFNPKVVRSSMGSIFRQGVHRKELFPTLEQLEAQGRTLAVADAEGASIYSQPLPQDVVLVFGSESQGVSESLKERVQEHRSIPALGSAESLNVALSAGIFGAEVLRGEFA